MRSIQCQTLAALRGSTAIALLMLCGCAADSTSNSNGPPAVVGMAPGATVGSGGAPHTATGGVQGTGGRSGGAPAPAPNLGTGGRAGVPIMPGVPPVMMTGTGGRGPLPGTGGQAGGGMAGAGMPAPAGSMDPVIPPVAGDCPMWQTGTITFMGLGGIDLEVGAMPSSPSAPMVFYWHGTGSTAGEYAFMATDVFQGVMQEGGVLVSFQDTTGGDGLSGTAIFGMSDFTLTDELLACAVRDRNVDPRRVFATGCSAGGLFSDAMGMVRSSYMAAVASNSGGSTGFGPAWENDHTPSLMTVHGAAGVDVVGLDFASASATADMVYKGRGAIAIDCDTGGQHCGGGGEAADIWQFFKDHPFGVTPEPYAGGLPSSFNSICKIQ